MAPNLDPIFQKHLLSVLDRLEYFMNPNVLITQDKDPAEYHVTFGDIFGEQLDQNIFDRPEQLYAVANFLRKNGVNLSVTFDLENDQPIIHAYPETSRESDVQLGILRGRNSASIRKSIKELREEFSEHGVINSRNGRIYYKDHPIRLGNRYYLVISCIWENREQGIVPYDTIRLYVIQHKKNIEEGPEGWKQINDDLSEFFKRTRYSSLSPSGLKIFETFSGEGIRLNNY